MNNGKICVSICAETADEVIEQVRCAEKLADVMEIRFDCLNEIDFDHLVNDPTELQDYQGIILATFRPFEQGGKKNLSYLEREEFWIDSPIADFTDWADLEVDFSENKISMIWGKVFKRIIKSNHYFEESPENLEEIYKSLLSEKPDAVKIAIQANDITDTIKIWKLLEKAKSENKQIIPIAMGEAGKWTRILGLAHGAFMTYAALNSGKETAPGQISAKDLIEVYRVKELNEDTEVYGVLGGNTSVSMSPYIHNAAFKLHNLNAVFIPLQVNDLDEFMRRMVKPETREIELNFKGFSVTIPHKQAIIKHLDSIDETARKIGAVNTVKITGGKLHGYNTDAPGFIEPLKNAYGDLTNVKVAVLGSGGAARACIYALQKEAAAVTIFARDTAKAQILADEFQVPLKDLNAEISNLESFQIVVNATPLGMLGALQNETPAVADHLKNVHLAYDLVYNPFETRFLREANSANVPTIGGLAMLIAQAMAQSKIWTGLDAPIKEMSRAALQRLQT